MAWFPYSFADGAPTTTSGKPLNDGNIDRIDQAFPGIVRRQIRWLNANTPDIPAIVQSATARTIGVGVTTQVESPDKKFNSAAEEVIEEFGRIGVGELTNRHHFNSAIRAISDFEVMDGGVLIRHHYNTEWDFPYKYELVGVDMIDISKTSFMRALDGSVTIGGLVLNKWRQIEAIWLFEDEYRLRSEKVSIKDLTYYSEVWVSIGQQMAVSKLAAILPTIDFLTQYSRAELEAAIESAKGGAFLKSELYHEIMLIALQEIQASTNLESQKADIYTILQSLARTGVKPNGLTPIPSGDEVQFPNARREGVYQQLNHTSEAKVAASQGMSAISMYGKAEQANYSAIKYSAETDQLTMNIRFDNIANKVIMEIHRRVIQVGIQLGLIPGRAAYWAKPSKFERFSYLRNTHVDIEPNKTAAANKINVDLQVKTRKEIVEKATGRKYEDYLRDKISQEIEEIRMREEMFAEAGIPIPQQQTTGGVKNAG